MEENFIYDVFLGHGAKDRAAACDLADRLGRDGLRVWLAERELKPPERAATRQRKIELGLQRSRALVMCLSKNVTDVEWDMLECQTPLFCNPNESTRYFIPLRLDDIQIKRAFANFEVLDWRDTSTEQYERLLSTCRPVQAPLQTENLTTQIMSEQLISLSYTSDVMGLAFSGDGHRAITGSEDLVQGYNQVLYDTSAESYSMQNHTDTTVDIVIKRSTGVETVTLDKSHDTDIRVWDAATGACLTTLENNTQKVRAVALTRDGRLALSGDGRRIRIWDVASGKCIKLLDGHRYDVLSLFSIDGQRLVSGSEDQTVRVWDVPSGQCLAVFEGHSHRVWGVALSRDGERVLSGSTDRTLRLWDVKSGRCLAVFEGHTDHVHSVALSDDGQRALSRSCDGTIRMWNATSGYCMAVLKVPCNEVMFIDGTRPSAFHRSTNGKVDLLNLQWTEQPALNTLTDATIYTNAKVVLVGNTGVGKTGLALRLCEDRWEATESTHGMIVSQLKFGTEEKALEKGREIWLWDFAGQPDYRLIHQLYMDETALGVFVFDPQDQHTFDELRYWEKALEAVGRIRGITPSKLLVAARCDRGGITVSKKRFEEFCKTHGYAGLWITGAKTGEGCENLKSAIMENICWDRLPWVTTTQLFKSLKDSVMSLKQEDTPLVRLPELRQRLQLKLPQQSISSESLRTVVGLMEGQGALKTLDFGSFVLLQPEQINRYAAMVVRMAREDVNEMGIVPEQRVLDGLLDYKDMSRLAQADEQVLLRAMVQTFLDRALCLRETTPAGVMLVFPSYLRRDKPKIAQYPDVFVTYGFSGPLDEIYAALVVKLSYSGGFRKDQLWKDAADFKTPSGKRVGLTMQKSAAGSADLMVYFEAGVPDDTKVMFIKYIHEHLLSRAQGVTRVRSYICPSCNTPIENRKAMEIRLQKGFVDMICAACENRVDLIDLIEQKFASDEFASRVRQMDETARINLDNESRELILVGHAFAVAGEAGQIYRQYSNSDYGIDGEIEFKDYDGKASGKKVYLQLKSGDSYLQKRKKDDAEIFTIKKGRWADYWRQQAYPVFLVIRTSDGKIRWMNVTTYLNQQTDGGKQIKQIVFTGEEFTASNLRNIRDRLI